REVGGEGGGAAGPAANASVISSVAITQGAQNASVRVEGEGHLEARTARMQNPERLVLDFAGARLAVQKTAIPGMSAPVRGVRLGQYKPDVVRVVIDLSETTPYEGLRDGNALVIFFNAQPATPVKLNTAKASPDFHNTAVAPRAVPRKVIDAKNSAPRFALPGELTQPSVALASFGGKSEPARPDGSTAA